MMSDLQVLPEDKHEEPWSCVWMGDGMSGYDKLLYPLWSH